ncbi:MAG: hypothetical protein SGJ15_02030 [Bacteroidota bacterium]|nr:hypothetical protein [Bacteroidota bacterium]
MRIVIGITILFFVFSSCNFNQEELKENGANMEWPENVVICVKGKYTSKKHQLKINVLLKDKLVLFILLNVNDSSLFSSNKPSVSNLHKWGFLLDSNGVVWIQSSDIGLYKLSNKNSKSFELNSFGVITKENYKSIPNGIFEILPHAIKRKFK